MIDSERARAGFSALCWCAPWGPLCLHCKPGGACCGPHTCSCEQHLQHLSSWSAGHPSQSGVQTSRPRSAPIILLAELPDASDDLLVPLVRATLSPSLPSRCSLCSLPRAVSCTGKQRQHAPILLVELPDAGDDLLVPLVRAVTHVEARHVHAVHGQRVEHLLAG